LRRLRSEIITEKSKILKPMEDAIAAAEREIEKNEALLDQLNREMVEASEQGDGARIGPLSQQIRACQEIIETRFAEMEGWTISASGWRRNLKSAWPNWNADGYQSDR
jgi:ATP-binding cassette subfamily F protein 3